ncbi:transposase [Burkholderia pseudomallei]|uniref:transposase n=1 Tax=Burkholderia pseudomallei TaxID=28450 RepID=UPI000C1B7552|nr:transposase [Burkholderia pseudomallei]
MSIISDLMGTTLTQSAEKKPGSRTGRPKYPRELRDRLAAAACEPEVSVAKLVRENGINANMLFTWRRRYLADQQARSAALVPVAPILAVDGFADYPQGQEVEVSLCVSHRLRPRC